jgi:hypothetical protein
VRGKPKAGGGQPQWDPDGGTLYYVDPDGYLWGATFDSDRGEPESPERLFRASFMSTSFSYYGGMAGYSVYDRDVFLVNRVLRQPDSGPVMVVYNWRTSGER